MKQLLNIILILFIIGVATGYTFRELSRFNTQVNRVLGAK